MGETCVHHNHMHAKLAHLSQPFDPPTIDTDISHRVAGHLEDCRQFVITKVAWMPERILFIHLPHQFNFMVGQPPVA